MNEKDPRFLTDVELELMQLIWKRGGATVHQLLEDLPKSRNLAYTTVSTMVRILEGKGFVRAEKGPVGKTHIYVPVIEREKYEARIVGKMVTQVFEDQPVALVRRLVDTGSLKKEELEELRKLLERTRP